MAEARRCPQCRGELAADAPQGLCPECLLKAGLGGQEEPEVGSEPAPTTPQGARFVPPEPAELAALFPQLEILELVGQGGMGAVYKARQPGLDRLVALKILPREVGSDPAFAERFAREARALAKLNHPHIVAVYDFGETQTPPLSPEGRGAGGEGPLYYFIMEYVDGVNIRQMLATGQLQPREALAIVPQVCEALQYAHEEGIVHRDIKPENVLVDRKGRVKIADFGLAKLLHHSATSAGGESPAGHPAYTLTGTGQVMGTLHYMAPEQIEHPQEVDHRADIYSLGVVFYEMLTGELPLGRFAPPSQKVQIDVRLDEVVLRSLEKERERRYQHASEVKTDVETISSSIRAAMVVPPTPAAVDDGEEASWSGFVKAVVHVFLVVLLCWFGFFTFIGGADALEGLGLHAEGIWIPLAQLGGLLLFIAGLVSLFYEWKWPRRPRATGVSPVPTTEKEPERRYQQASHVKAAVESMATGPAPPDVPQADLELRLGKVGAPLPARGRKAPVGTLIACGLVVMASFMPWGEAGPEGACRQMSILHRDTQEWRRVAKYPNLGPIKYGVLPQHTRINAWNSSLVWKVDEEGSEEYAWVYPNGASGVLRLLKHEGPEEHGFMYIPNWVVPSLALAIAAMAMLRFAGIAVNPIVMPALAAYDLLHSTLATAAIAHYSQLAPIVVVLVLFLLLVSYLVSGVRTLVRRPRQHGGPGGPGVSPVPAGPLPARHRPKSPIVLGWFCILLSMPLLVLASLEFPVVEEETLTDAQEALLAEAEMMPRLAPGREAYMDLTAVIHPWVEYLLATALFAAGIGLILVKSWGRRIGLAFAIGQLVWGLALLPKVAHVPTGILQWEGIRAEIRNEVPIEEPPWAVAFYLVVMYSVLFLASFGLPMLLLILLNRPKLVAALRAPDIGQGGPGGAGV